MGDPMLAAALLERISPTPDPVAPEALEAKLQALLRASREAWPAVQLTGLDYVRSLAPHLTGAPLLAQLDALHASDLFLATGCVAGDRHALTELSEHLLPAVCASLKRIDPGSGLSDEVGQRLREKLLMPGADGEIRLASYSGQGALLHWLRAIAVRDALKLRQSELRQGQVEAQALAVGAPVVDLELEILRRLHRDEFRTAFDTAFRALAVRERNLLRMHVLDGLNIDQIGAFYRTHRTTAFRWLEAAREALSVGIRNALSSRLGLSRLELDSLIGLVRSQLDLSLRKLLAVSSP